MPVKSTKRTIPNFLKVVLLIVGCCVFAATVFGAYSGYTHPAKSVIPALACMAFAAMFLASGALVAIFIFVDRRFALVGLVALMLSAPSFLIVCPLNFSGAHSDETVSLESDSFSVLTYNTFFFNSHRSVELDSADAEATAEAILTADATVVVMQETPPFDIFAIGRSKVSPTMSAAVRLKYPYRLFTHRSMAVMSKVPFKRVELYYDDMSEPSFLLERYDVALADTVVHIFNVHLQSLHIPGQVLSVALSPDSIVESSTRLLYPRLKRSFRKRAMQAEILCGLIERLGQEPVVVAGDFNDVPGCYAERMLLNIGLRDCYAASGTGFGVSFRKHHLYFRIDQMLCSDGLEPLYSRVIKSGGSDHYPLYTMFKLR